MENDKQLPTQGGLYEYRDGVMVALEGPATEAAKPDGDAGGNADQPTGETA